METSRRQRIKDAIEGVPPAPEVFEPPLFTLAELQQLSQASWEEYREPFRMGDVMRIRLPERWGRA